MMEDIKKQQILHVAMGVFKEKGYTSSSMQEIAEACGMAKGSIYKIFPSKEDLFTAVFELCHQGMFEKASQLDSAGKREGLTPKEQLLRKIEFQLQYMLENYFFMVEFKELPIKDNETFQAAWKKKRATLLTWHKNGFLEAYGAEISPYIWDVVAIFRGLLKEYLFYVMQKGLSLTMSELAHFLIERMNAVVADMLDAKPKAILNETNIYFNSLNPISLQTQQLTIHEFLQVFSLKISELQKPANLRQELQEVVHILQKELALETPNKTLVNVCLSYLDAVSELKPLARQLTYML
ncbi:TetR/AcrR family transcriptional regulator [Brevibacillus reuszeri]|uniref:TetR/AcrR family transcriptional regulator n=1 Tax=Brevibacillus reuszeri TaxID=54915 RepID=UPI003D1AC32E